MALDVLDAGEAVRLLGDPEVPGLGLAALEAIRAGTVEPLLAALEGKGPGLASLRKAAAALGLQGLAPTVCRLPGANALPAPLAEHLAAEAGRASERETRLLELVAAAVSTLRLEGVAAVLLKGAALVVRGVVPPGTRGMADLDLLVTQPREARRAAEILARRLPYRFLLETPRHLVLAQREERMVRFLSEDPDNPLRIEVHSSFRLPVLGRVLDATSELVKTAESVAGPGGSVLVPALCALRHHLWLHAAEDFAAKGLRGVQILDFVHLARGHGAATAGLRDEDVPAAEPLLFAADAVERLFPGSFEARELAALGARVPASLRARAAALPVLRFSRPAHGWTVTSLGLISSPAARARFLLRTLFPTLGEVRANVAHDASGVRLALAWCGVILGRFGSALQRGVTRR